MTAIMGHLKGFSGMGNTGATPINQETNFPSSFISWPLANGFSRLRHNSLWPFHPKPLQPFPSLPPPRPLIISVPGLRLSKSGTSDTLTKLPTSLCGSSWPHSPTHTGILQTLIFPITLYSSTAFKSTPYTCTHKHNWPKTAVAQSVAADVFYCLTRNWRLKPATATFKTLPFFLPSPPYSYSLWCLPVLLRTLVLYLHTSSWRRAEYVPLFASH